MPDFLFEPYMFMCVPMKLCFTPSKTRADAIAVVLHFTAFSMFLTCGASLVACDR